MSGLGVGTSEEEARGGGLPGHHDHQPGHAEGQQGGLSAGKENVIQKIFKKIFCVNLLLATRNTLTQHKWAHDSVICILHDLYRPINQFQ